jgi:hypothetical protein
MIDCANGAKDRKMLENLELGCNLGKIDQNLDQTSVILRLFLSDRKMMMHLSQINDYFKITITLLLLGHYALIYFDHYMGELFKTC